MFGYSTSRGAAVTIGGYGRFILTIWRASWPAFARCFRESLAAGRPSTECRCADGTYAPVIDCAIRNPGPFRRTRVVGAVLDVTDLKRAEAEVREEARINETLYRIGKSLAAELDMSKLVQQLIDEARVLTGAECGVFLYEAPAEDGERRLLTVQSGDTWDRVPGSTFELATLFGEPPSGLAIRRDDISTDASYAASYFGAGVSRPDGRPVRSYLAVPVISRSGEIVGGLFFGQFSWPGVFTSRDERLVQGIALQTAVSIDNAKLFQKAKQAIEVRDHFVRSRVTSSTLR